MSAWLKNGIGIFLDFVMGGIVFGRCIVGVFFNIYS